MLHYPFYSNSRKMTDTKLNTKEILELKARARTISILL